MTFHARVSPTAAGRSRPAQARAGALLALLLLTGCAGSSADLANDLGALGVGGAVGAATANPALGILAGVGARFAIDEGYLYGERRFFGAKQDAIAAAAGAAEIGEVVAWTFEGPLDLGDARGRVEVVRAFGEQLRCKEVVFTLEPLAKPLAPVERPRDMPPVDPQSPLPEGAEVLTSTVCKGPDGWAWAVARPSATQWQGLQ